MTVTLTPLEILLAGLLAPALFLIFRRRTSPTSGVSGAETFNTAVRSIVTLALTGGFIWGFAVLKLISSEVFTTMYATCIGFWFGTRIANARAGDGQTTSVTTDDAKIVTGPAAPTVTRRKGERS